MNKTNQLAGHYNRKYAESDFKQLKPVKIGKYPLDRFEAAVYWSEKGGSFLEIGCGSGGVLLSIKDKYLKCTGVELSEVRAGEMRKLFSDYPNVNILTGNIEDENLPLDTESFDTIVVNAVVEHLITPISSLKYLVGLLKPGGKIIIITPNIAKWTRRIKLFCGYFPSTASWNEGLLRYDGITPTELYDDGHFHYFTYRSLKKIMLERLGISKVKCHGFGRPVFLTRLLPKLFSDCVVVGIK